MFTAYFDVVRRAVFAPRANTRRAASSTTVHACSTRNARSGRAGNN
jgi:hypothetical protein